MKIKIGELKNIHESLTKLFRQDIDIKLAFKYQDAVRKINEKHNDVIKINEKLGKKYGVAKLNGNMIQFDIPPMNVEKYFDEINPLLDEEIEIEWEVIPLSKLDDLKLSMIDAENLKEFIDKTK